MKQELGDQPPLGHAVEQALAAVEAGRVRRLAELVGGTCKRAVQHIMAHKVGGWWAVWMGFVFVGARRLAELMGGACKRAVQHIMAHKVGFCQTQQGGRRVGCWMFF